MAFVNGNKPIVTDGLVYALDFGNQKSYVSGSLSVNNLTYSTVTSSIIIDGNLPIPPLVNQFLEFNWSGSSEFGIYIQRPGMFSNLTYVNGEYTICTVYNVKGAGKFFSQHNGQRFASDVSTTNLTQRFDSVGVVGRTYTRNMTQTQHVTYRYRSGSYDLFINGIPITASGINPSSADTQTDGFFWISGRQTNGNNYFTGSLGNFYLYNRALSSNEIWDNYQLSAPRYGLGPVQNKPYNLDENAYLFLQSAGITDPIITGSIDTFVRGLKSASLWDKMIAIYPFVGTGSTGINLTGSHRWNLKEPSLVTYPLSFTGSWIGSTSGSAPSGSGTNITMGGITPSTFYPNLATSSVHISILSYDTPVSSSYLMGTGMTEDLAISTLAGDYGTPAAAYSVRKVRTAYSGALMDVRRSLDNVTSSIGYVSNGDLDTGSLLDFVGTGPDDHGFVARWYDQSGNNRHATQTTQANQPTIVLSGSILTINTKPGVYFDGINDGYNITQLAGRARLDAYFVMTTSDTKYIIPDNNGSNYYGFVADSGSVTDTNNYFSNAILYTNNSNPLTVANTRNQVWQSLSTGTQRIALHQSATSTGWTNYYLGTAPIAGTDYNYSGSFQEIVIYDADKSTLRDPIHYGINSYYNIYTQPSASFATSSFTIQAGSTSVSASLNNRLTSGITTSGPLGLITVSRTGSNSLTIARNGVTSSFAVPASGALSTEIYLGAVNNNGLALGNSPLNISFASVGTGLTGIELGTYDSLVNNLQYNLGKTDPNYQAVLDYATLQGYTLPSVSQRLLQNKLIVDLKNAGIWYKLDSFAVFATNGSTGFALIDWKRLSQYTAINSPTFTPNQGFKGGGTSYINTNYTASLNAINYSQNNASIGVYVLETAPGYMSALQTTPTNVYAILVPNRGFNLSRFNDAGAGGTPTSNITSTGLISMNRVNSTTYNFFNNGVLHQQVTETTTGVPNEPFLLLGGPIITEYYAAKISICYMGSDLTNEQGAFTNILNRYITAISS